MTRDGDDTLWLDALLRDVGPAALDDDGFSAGVLARIAVPTPMLPPQAALTALRRAQRDERRHTRWTIGGIVLGVAVASLAWLGGVPAAAESTTSVAPVIALLVVSCSLAWWAIAAKRDDVLW